MWGIIVGLLLMVMPLTRAELAARILKLPPDQRAIAMQHLQRIAPSAAPTTGRSGAPSTMMRELPVTRYIPSWSAPLREPKNHKGLSGGRGSGKSHFYAEELVDRMVQRPNLRAVCVREFQRSLEFSAKALIEKKIRTLGVASQFEIQNTRIKRIGGTGIIIFEGLQDHTADTIKSLEGFDIAWVEEAQSLSERSLEILLPTIREPGSEVWFSWNPDQKTDPVDAMFGESMNPEFAVRVHTTYLDNPLLDEGTRKRADALKHTDPDKYNHIWLGKYNIGGKGRVYSKFLEREFPEGNIDDSVIDYGGTIYIGQDFNVNPMCSIIAQKVSDECHVLDALALEVSNTVEVCEEVQRRYGGRHVVFCPDPAGNQRRTSTTVVGQTDFTIIRSYGFEVRAQAAHPAVVDRENNANMMYEHEGRRRVRIHPRATVLIEALNGLKYKPGTSQRDKNSRYDHPCDAIDYLLWEEFNVLIEAGTWGSSNYSIGYAK